MNVPNYIKFLMPHSSTITQRLGFSILLIELNDIFTYHLLRNTEPVDKSYWELRSNLCKLPTVQSLYASCYFIKGREVMETFYPFHIGKRQVLELFRFERLYRYQRVKSGLSVTNANWNKDYSPPDKVRIPVVRFKPGNDLASVLPAEGYFDKLNRLWNEIYGFDVNDLEEKKTRVQFKEGEELCTVKYMSEEENAHEEEGTRINFCFGVVTFNRNRRRDSSNSKSKPQPPAKAGDDNVIDPSLEHYYFALDGTVHGRRCNLIEAQIVTQAAQNNGEPTSSTSRSALETSGPGTSKPTEAGSSGMGTLEVAVHP